ncbi:MAG: aldehyde dehydrogenase family protein [Chloroflexi bacterium]|nr:aldehyde dehydrogenase family protein [Chloroflexota bacterium]
MSEPEVVIKASSISFPRDRKISFTNGELISYDPATLQENGRVKVSSEEDVQVAVAHAHQAFPLWSSIPLGERISNLKRLSNLIYDDVEEIAALVSRECGKPKIEALTSEILPVLNMISVYTSQAEKWLAAEKPPFFWLAWLLGKSAKITYKPFGVVGVITPWNYPFYYDFGPALMALLAGNTVILKPSEYTPLVGKKAQELFAKLNLPPGTFQVIHGAGDVGQALIRARVDKIAFTGSPKTARAVLATAAERLTPVVMELGGKDAAIVLEDAPLETTAAGVAWAGLTSAGQVCASVERVYVSEKIAKPFIDRLVNNVQGLRMGQGLDPEVDMGPLTNERQLEIVKGHLRQAVEHGAQVLTGGKTKDQGLFFEPAVLVGVDRSMSLMREETFGPALPVVAVKDEEEAVRLANDSSFGLTASVWSLNRERAEKVAQRLRAGAVTINDHAVSAGLPNMPWGGIGESGFGRIHGRQGMQEFVYPSVIVGERFPRWKRLWWYPYNQKSYQFFRSLLVFLTNKPLLDKIRAISHLWRNLDLRRLH